MECLSISYGWIIGYFVIGLMLGSYSVGFLLETTSDVKTLVSSFISMFLLWPIMIMLAIGSTVAEKTQTFNEMKSRRK